MPTTYVPKLHTPVVAVRTKQDLLVPKGDWITIDDQDNVTQYTNAEFIAIYGRGSNTEHTGARQARRDVKVGKSKSSNNYRSIDSTLSTQSGRFFYLLRALGGQHTLKEVTVMVSPPDNPNSVSAAFTMMSKLGVIKKIERVGEVSLWEVTYRGCVAFDRLGPVCFTKYNMPIPPSKLVPPVADVAKKDKAELKLH